VEQIEEQARTLRDPNGGYRALCLHVAGAPGPWEFGADDEVELHEGAGVLIVRSGAADEDAAPEHVFRLEAIVASELV
jgi:hypothetical protein